MASRTSRPIPTRLPLQLLAVMIAMAALTAGAIGIPAIWLARQQLDRQAWARLEAGSHTLQASLEAGLSDLSSLALLTAQRPTLLQLIDRGDEAAIQDYLQTLQSGASLDLLVLCQGGNPRLINGVTSAGEPIPEDVCALPDGAQITRLDTIEPPGWQLASDPVQGNQKGVRIVAGHALDQASLIRLQNVSGIDTVIVHQGEQIADSFTTTSAARIALIDTLRTSGETASLTITGEPYFARRDAFGQGDVEIISALSTSNIAAAEAQLSRTIALGVLIDILAASLLAILLARRISLPLERLRAAAIGLRKGDLTTPVTANTYVIEIAQVAYALEDARLALYHSLEALRREKEWNDDLLGSISEGIVTLDNNARVTFFSHGAEKLSGRSSERVIGKHIDDVFTLSEGGSTRLFSQKLPARGVKRSLVTIVNGGRQLALAITAADLAPPQARRVGTALVLRDVTDEEAIRRVLGDFLANITHEFRTPLSALAASIELMMEQLPSLSEAEIGELLDSLRLGTLSLQTLIDNLLEGASIEAGRFRVQPRPVDLETVIADARRTMQPLLEKYHQQLVVEVEAELPLVSADPRRTGQTLVNLLSNAIKWSPSDSTLRLSACSDAHSVTVKVEDCGPGIPPEQLKDVFTRFAHLQIDDPRAAYGAGLGLSVVKAIVEAQGGQVGVENIARGGAAFYFTIPLFEPAHPENSMEGQS